MSEDNTRRGKSRGSAASQFKPGESGNPGGRTPGSPNRSTILREVFGEKVGANIGGKSRKIPVGEAFTRKLLIKALEGDPQIHSRSHGALGGNRSQTRVGT